MRLLSRIGVAIAACALMVLLAPVRANAAVILTYACDGTAVQCNGATFAVGLEQGNFGGFQYELTFGIRVDSDTLGDYVNAVGIKNILDNYAAGAILFSAPTGTTTADWEVILSGLNADGCKDTGEDGVCAEAVSPSLGAPIPTLTGSNTADLVWVFRFNSTDSTPATTAHIKFLFVDSEGTKVGDLGSFDTGIDGGGGGGGGGEGGGGGSIPEPASVTLVGLGLLGAAWRARKQRVVS